ncbi:MAG: hypothetical protein ACI30A_06965 [Paludibacteraceae bacterium]
MDSRWKLYQGALVWSGNPKEMPPTQQQTQEAIAESGAMFARWTSDFDMSVPTQWWYCICDKPFDITSISAKHRYVIKQGIKHFDVREINPAEYAEELTDVQVKAFAIYPKQYRPVLDKQKIIADIHNGCWETPHRVFAAFHRETGELSGYALVYEHNGWVDFMQQKTVPSMEKLQVNAALVNGVVSAYNSRLSKDFYIVDGERNIKHQTNFFQYLIKYFEFRLAYCRLNIEYNKYILLIINILYPFMGGGKIIAQVSSAYQ